MSYKNADFIGFEKLIEKRNATLSEFRVWNANRDWKSFHDNHYDWWMFPYERPSSYGYTYSVFEYEQQTLKQIPRFLSCQSEAAQLLLFSWGWNIKHNEPLWNPDLNQTWAFWPIRLFKCSRSMKLFGLLDEYGACVEYAKYLVGNNISLDYRGKDLSVEIIDDSCL